MNEDRKQMTSTRGRCVNLDYCSIASRRRDVEIALGERFICPECGKPLRPPVVESAASSGRLLRNAALAGVAILLAGGSIFAFKLYNDGYFQGGHSLAPVATQGTSPGGIKVAVTPHALKAASASTATAEISPLPASPLPASPLPASPLPASLRPAAYIQPAPQAETTVLRLSGSNTVGANFGPRLAQAFLAEIGDSNISIVPSGKPDEIKAVGMRGDKREAIAIAAHGSATAFTDLASGAADVGMASRRVKSDEAAGLAALGDMTSVASEHVLALDGIAVIVNPANPVAALTKAQLHDIFSGTVTNWSSVGGPNAPIDIFARDDKSGTYDTFKSLVLGGSKLAIVARRVEDSRELSSDVSTDAHAIGFIGLPYILSAKALAIADTGATPLFPNRLTVATEDYPLSRRLYVYTPSQNPNPLAVRFAEFALSPAGQSIAEAAGFIPLTVTVEAAPAPAPQIATARYRAVIGHATRLSVNFRFEPNSIELDNRSQRDLDRLVNFVMSSHIAPPQLILAGFADNTGRAALNDNVARKRADAVAAALAQHGVKVGRVAAFGAELPVADNSTIDGREKNRRVEVYVLL